MTPEEIINQVNEYRKSKGLAPLKLSPVLMKAAAERAKDMVSSSNLTHRDASGNKAWPSYIKRNGYLYSLAGENLAFGFDTATDTMAAWTTSPNHNHNLLNSEYSEMGIAVLPGVYNGKKSNYVIHFFGNPLPSPKPTPIKSKAETRPVVPKKAVLAPPNAPPSRPFSYTTPAPTNANSTIPMIPNKGPGRMTLK